MGIFFYTKSVALIEDIPLEKQYNNSAQLITDMDTGFQQVCRALSLVTGTVAGSLKPYLFAERLQLLDCRPALPGDTVRVGATVLDEQQVHLQRLVGVCREKFINSFRLICDFICFLCLC